MFTTSFSIYNLEYFLAILARIGGLLTVAPIYSQKSVPPRVRLFLAVGIAWLVTGVTGFKPLPYTTFLGFTVVLIKELITGLTIGLMATICVATVNMAGQFIDREIGFSMASTFDQINGGQSTVSADMYTYGVMLIMIVSGMHYFVITAVCDSFKVIPVGEVIFDTDGLMKLAVSILTDYFIIAMRICMPVFVAATVLNVVLGILAKASPQLSMFSIGMQLKVLVGLTIVVLTVMYLPNVTQFVYDGMETYVTTVIKTMY
ncbi:MAG: flagellar biosynthetic protein FliR [Lachnospiraceae bacterium]|nr:flagellar biosynthetic protein FliR [Lachnospiraceae bacterium]